MEEAWELAIVIQSLIVTEATKQVSNALEKTFERPTGAVGSLIADKIQFMRWKSAIKILQKARKHLEDEGLLSDANLPDLKFFLPWSEGCSLECEDEDLLHSIWASLLVSELTNPNPNSLIYIDIIRKLNRPHVEYLKNLLSGPFPLAAGNPAITFGLRRQRMKLVEPLISHPRKGVLSKVPKDKLLSQIKKINDSPGAEVLSVGVSRDGMEGFSRPDPFSFEYIREEDADCEGEQPDLIYSSLAALELIERHSGEIEVMRSVKLRYSMSLLTPLGWDFLKACLVEFD